MPSSCAYNTGSLPRTGSMMLFYQPGKSHGSVSECRSPSWHIRKISGLPKVQYTQNRCVDNTSLASKRPATSNFLIFRHDADDAIYLTEGIEHGNGIPTDTPSFRARSSPMIMTGKSAATLFKVVERTRGHVLCRGIITVPSVLESTPRTTTPCMRSLVVTID